MGKDKIGLSPFIMRGDKKCQNLDGNSGRRTESDYSAVKCRTADEPNQAGRARRVRFSEAR
jgi:hypothetical protein